MEAVLHALADPHRRTILEALREGWASVGDLTDLVPIAQSGVSRHLRVLRDADLVESHPAAQRRLYALRPEPLIPLDSWLAPYRDLWVQRMDALRTEIARGKRDRGQR